MSSGKLRVRLHSRNYLIEQMYYTPTDDGGLRNGGRYLNRDMVDLLGTDIGIWDYKYRDSMGNRYYRSVTYKNPWNWYTGIIKNTAPKINLKNIYEGGNYAKNTV